MAVQDKSTIKGYFQTGDKPTQTQFEHLIDSYTDYSSFLTNLASAAADGTTGFVLIASNNSAASITGGSVGLNVLQSDTAASAQSAMGLTGSVPTATTAQANAGTATGVYMDPVLVKNAINALSPSVSYASTAQATSGLATGVGMDPVLTRNAIEQFALTSAVFATTAQASAGTSTGTVMNPSLTRIAAEQAISNGYATTAAANAGTAATGLMNPVLTKNAIAALGGAGSGALTLVTSKTAGGNSVVDFTDLQANSHYILYMDSVYASSRVSGGAIGTLGLRTSTNNGVSYDAAASAYSFSYYYISAATTLELKGKVSTNSKLMELGPIGMSIWGISGKIEVFNPAGAAMQPTSNQNPPGCQIMWTLNPPQWTSDPSPYQTNGVGRRSADGADVDAIRILVSADVITTGRFSLYRLATV